MKVIKNTLLFGIKVVAAVAAAEVLHIGHGQREGPGTGQPREELG